MMHTNDYTFVHALNKRELQHINTMCKTKYTLTIKDYKV